MKKLISCVLIFPLVLLVACTASTQEINTTTSEIQETIPEYVTWPPDMEFPERNSFVEEGGYDLGDFQAGKHRSMFYSLCHSFASFLPPEISYGHWEILRSNEQFHNESILVSFIKEFNVSREDFERLNEDRRLLLESLDFIVNKTAHAELFPVDLIYTFDNELINEYFRWENSIYAHEVGIPNPLRGDWDENGEWQDHPNWTENPGWREHKFWEYLPFNDE